MPKRIEGESSGQFEEPEKSSQEESIEKPSRGRIRASADSKEELSRAKEELEESEVLRDFQENFKKDFDSGLIGLDLETKIVQGKKIGSTESKHSGAVELGQNISFSKRSFPINAPLRYVNRVKEFDDSNVAILVEAAVAYDTKIVEVKGLKGIWNKLLGKEVHTEEVRAALMTDIGGKDKEKVLNLNIGYYLDNAQYAENRPMKCSLHVVMRESLINLFLQEVEKNPKKLWEMIKIMVPELLDAAPPGKKNPNAGVWGLSGENLAISDNRGEIVARGNQAIGDVKKENTRIVPWDKNKK